VTHQFTLGTAWARNQGLKDLPEISRSRRKICRLMDHQVDHKGIEPLLPDGNLVCQPLDYSFGFKIPFQ
jgi:hypothetical protein